MSFKNISANKNYIIINIFYIIRYNHNRLKQFKGYIMITYGVTDIQNKPSLIKAIDIAKIIDKRAHTTLGYFISSKYDNYIKPIIEKIDREEKLAKLNKLKQHQDLEFAEIGVDDGIK